MAFSVWKRWVLSLPWALRWFILLILIRPLIDNFYYLKQISPFLSPLYIVGVLTPILIIVSFFSRHVPARQRSGLDQFFGLWGALLFLNALALLMTELSLDTLEASIKITIIALIYFFFRRLIQSKRDLLGVVTTFLYSTIFPFGMMVYENVFSPINTQMGRGLVRSHGAYADVLSYAIYIAGALLVAGYLFMEMANRRSFSKGALRLIMVGGLCMLGLLSIHHGASWLVCLAVVLLLIFYNVGGKQASALVFILLIVVSGFFFMGDAVTEKVAVLFESEVEVVEGDRDMDRAFHGRMGRWKQYLAYWDEMPLVSKMFGVSMMSARPQRAMILVGIHNDYLRIMFASGIVGLLAYLSFYLVLFMKSWSLARSDRFLLQGGMAIILMYSITAVPTLYPSLLYILMAIFAYAALPKPAWRRVPVAPMRRVHPRMPSSTTRLTRQRS